MHSSPSIDVEDPSEDQPREPSLRAASLWLVVAGLAILFLPLYLISANVRREIASLEARLEPLQATLTHLNTPEPEVLELMNNLAQLEASISEIDAIRSTLVASRDDWPAIMITIGSYDPTQLMLVSLSQRGREITLRGRATSDSVVAAYARSLEMSDLFERVTVQSMRSITMPVTPSPTPTPTPEATPTAEPTSTPDPRDPHEPDDARPNDIFPGQPQLHNFHPAGDVDQVKFLAKAGRHYRVFTSDLAPGVDTFLTVRVGEATYTNDDYKPGTLSSEVIFQVPAGLDVDVVAQITNRGNYGPGMSYLITVEEIVPTRTPTPTSTPTGTPTSTAVPTATPTSTVLPTATPTATPLPGTAGTVSGLSSLLRVSRAGLLAPDSTRYALGFTVEFVIVLVPRAIAR